MLHPTHSALHGIPPPGTPRQAPTGNGSIGYGQFDIPVRFDTDDLGATLVGNKVMAWDAIPIVGLKLPTT